jgi:hypothetical protein
MPSPNATPTPITPPRVPLIDPRTGLIDRAWYLFFLSLNQIANDAVQSTDSIGPDSASLIASYSADLQALAQFAETLPPVVTLPVPDILTDCCSALVSQMAEMQKQIEGLQSQPVLDIGAVNASIAALSTVPVTVTADFTVGTSNWYINNKTGSTCTVTLPTASTFPGRYLTFQNYQAQTLVSASSNVVPQAGGAAGTAILLAVAGNWATMVSDGTNWVIMQAAANNCLLLE